MGDSYIGQIDAFAVHCPELKASFLVPIDAVSATQRAALRVKAAISNQASGIRWAAHYVLDPGTLVFFTPGEGE